MSNDEVDMGHENGPQRLERRIRLLSRAIKPIEQLVSHPFHDRLPDCVFGREVSKKRALRDIHLSGDGGGGDVARVLRARERDDSLDRKRLAFVRWKVVRRHGCEP